MANGSKDGDLSNVYINERGRIVFAGFSSRYYLSYYTVNIIQNGEACPEVRYYGLYFSDWHVRGSNPIRDWNSLVCRTSWDKNHLIEIYDALYHFTDYVYDSGHQFPFVPGSVSLRSRLFSPVDSAVVGKIPFELTKWVVQWSVDNEYSSASSPMHRYD